MPTTEDTPAVSPNHPSTISAAEAQQWFTSSGTLSASQSAEVLNKIYKSRGRRAEKIVSDEPLVPLENFSFGADPEGFLFRKDTGVPVSAAGVIPGHKWEPHKVDKGAVQVDGMAVEYNIDPVTNHADWEAAHVAVQEQLIAMLPDDLEVRWVPSVVFSDEEFDKAPDDAKELGCMPDVDAWTGGINPPPNFAEMPTLRCAGGHLHVGWSRGEDVCGVQHMMNCQDLGKQLDWFLGGWSLSYDHDDTRRRLYGKAGAIRYKDYGLEYRVLSNFWVATPELRRMVWDRMVSAIGHMSNLYVPDRLPDYGPILRKSINTSQPNSDLLYLAKFPLMYIDPSYCRF